MNINGIVPPLVTPLTDRDSLDHAGLERLLEAQIAAGVDGVFILGTTGEGPSLSQRLRREMIAETGRRLAGRVPLYVGITDTSLVDAIELARFALQHTATAVVAAPPFYFPAGQTELQHWFVELADALPLPLLLYNMPSCVRIVIEQESLIRLIDHKNIIGLKDSSGDLEYFREVIKISQARRPGWPVLMGPEALLVEAMQLGAVGGVTGGANLSPRLFVELFSAIQSSDVVTVERLKSHVLALQKLYAFGKYGSSYLKGLKCALQLNGICSGKLAAPFDEFRPAQQQQVRLWLNEFTGSEYI